jgi:hypothetical protein
MGYPPLDRPIPAPPRPAVSPATQRHKGPTLADHAGGRPLVQGTITNVGRDGTIVFRKANEAAAGPAVQKFTIDDQTKVFVPDSVKPDPRARTGPPLQRVDLRSGTIEDVKTGVRAHVAGDDAGHALVIAIVPKGLVSIGDVPPVQSDAATTAPAPQ